MKLEINERKEYRRIHKYVGIKEDVTEQQRGHQRNQRINQNISRDKLKQNYSIPNYINTAKVVLRGKLLVMQACLKK